MTRSARNTASSTSWVTKITVLRSAFCNSRSCSCRRSRAKASSAPNGSSIKQDQRIGGERARDRHALAHAARDPVDVEVGERGELDQFEVMTGDAVLVGGRQVAAILQTEADVAEHGEPGEGGVGLEHHALLAARPGDLPPLQVDRAARSASRGRRPCASPWSCRSRTGRRTPRTRPWRCRARAARPLRSRRRAGPRTTSSRRGTRESRGRRHASPPDAQAR